MKPKASNPYNVRDTLILKTTRTGCFVGVSRRVFLVLASPVTRLLVSTIGCVCAFSFLPKNLAFAQIPDGQTFQVQQALSADVSLSALKDVALREPSKAALSFIKRPELLSISIHSAKANSNRLPTNLAPSQDGALQVDVRPDPLPTLVKSFPGLGHALNADTTLDPPDTNGAVGESQYVQIVNTQLAVFARDRSSTKLFGPAYINTVFAGSGTQCASKPEGDPIVTYDKGARRWLISEFLGDNGPGAPFAECIAVSVTADALGKYYRYEFETPSFNDYPKIGVWPDAYYVTYNMVHDQGARVCALDRSMMINPVEHGIVQKPLQICHEFANGQWSLLPADVDGPQPPANLPEFLMNIDSDGQNLNVWRFAVNWKEPRMSILGVGANSSPNTRIHVKQFVEPCTVRANSENCDWIAQNKSPTLLDALGDRLMYRLAYRRNGGKQGLIVSHNVALGPGRVGVRWYQFNLTGLQPTVVQQGTYSPNGWSRWMGSAAMDRFGQVAVGYSVTGKGESASIAVAAQELGAGERPDGRLGAETVLVQGIGEEFNVDRWGDYSSLTVDPLDDCTFWYTTEYFTQDWFWPAPSGNSASQYSKQGDASGGWDSYVVVFRLRGCTGKVIRGVGGVTRNSVHALVSKQIYARRERSTSHAAAREHPRQVTGIEAKGNTLNSEVPGESNDSFVIRRTWGSDGVRVYESDSEVLVQIACVGRGTFLHRFPISAKIIAYGRFTQRRGGPSRFGVDDQSNPARYVVSAAKSTMVFSVETVASKYGKLTKDYKLRAGSFSLLPSCA